MHWQALTLNVVYNENADGNNQADASDKTQNGTPKTVLFDSSYTVLDNTNETMFNRIGYRFTGWVDGNGTTVTIGANEHFNYYYTYDSVSDTYTATLYAQWEETTYTINFNGNGTVENPASLKAGFTSQNETRADIPYTTNITLPNLYDREGYDFIGWSKNANAVEGDGSIFTATAQYSGDDLLETNVETGSITLYAIWKAQPVDFTVNFFYETLLSARNGLQDDETLNSSNYAQYSFTTTLPTQADAGTEITDEMLLNFANNFINSNTTLKAGYKGVIASAVNSEDKIIVLGDESLVINLYFTRGNYNVTINKGVGIDSISVVTTVQGANNSNLGYTGSENAQVYTVYAGESVNISASELPGYGTPQFTENSTSVNTSDLQPLTVNKDRTFTVSATPQIVNFTVNKYLETLTDGKYTLSTSSTQQGITDATVTVTPNGTEGSYTSVTIIGNGGNSSEYSETGFSYEKFNIGQDAGFNAEQPGSVTVDGSGNLIINIYFSRNSYTLKVDAGNGIESVSPEMDDNGISIKFGDSQAINAVVKGGYSWSRWEYSGTRPSTFSQGSQEQTIVMGAGDVTLTATATTIPYKITYQRNSADENVTLPTTPQNYDVETNLVLVESSRVGYQFSGYIVISVEVGGITYNTDEEVVGGWIIGSEITNLSVGQGKYGNVVLEATWNPNQYTIVYNSNGGQVADGTDLEITASYGTSCKLSDGAGFTKEGYTFGGWARNEAGTDTTGITEGYALNLTDENNGIVEIYAIWNANTYKIVFHRNYDNLDETTFEQTGIKYDTSTPLTAVAFTTAREGYTFLYWTTEQDGTGDIYNANDSVLNLTSDPDGSVNFYAQWKANRYAITLNLNLGSLTNTQVRENTVYAEYDSNNLYIDETSDTIVTPIAQRSGYTFDGWTETDGGTDILISKDGTLLETWNRDEEAAVNVYAKYLANTYQITLNPNTTDTVVWTPNDLTPVEGTNNKYVYMTYNLGNIYKTRTATEGSSDGYPYVPNDSIDSLTLTREGYKFLGFATSENAQTANIIGEDGKMIGNSTFTADTTLYAVWQIQPYTLTIESDGAMVSNITVTGNNTEVDPSGNEYSITYGYTVRVTFNVEAGYSDFVTITDDIPFVNNEFTMPAKDITLTITTKSNLVNVNLNLNDDSGATKANEFTYSNVYVEYNTKNIYANRSASDITEPQEGASALTSLAPTRAGYTFLGWATSPSGDVITDTQGMLIDEWHIDTIGTGAATDGAVTLYARWQANTDTTYSVRYYLQNIKSDTYAYTARLDRPGSGTTDTTVSEEALAVFTGINETGFTYRGSYNVGNIGTGSVAYDGTNQNLNIAGNGSLIINIFLTRDFHTLTIVYDNGQPNGSATQQYGSTLEITRPTRTGYTFSMWNDPTGAGSVAENENDFIYTFGAGDETITALWTADVTTITLDNGGDNGVNLSHTTIYARYDDANLYDIDPNTVDDSALSSHIITPKATKLAYDFNGFYDSTNNVVISSLGAININNGVWNRTEPALTLSARFTAHTYNISYSAGLDTE